METLIYFEMCNKVAAKLNWPTSGLYTFIKGWWEKQPIPFDAPINYN